MKAITRVRHQLCSRQVQVIAVQVFFGVILFVSALFVVFQIVWFTFLRKPNFVFTAEPAEQVQQLISPIPTPNNTELWLGADSATSIPLIGSDKVIWLFGDTIIGSFPTEQHRETRYFIHNTVGQLDTTSRTRMKFFWKKTGETPSEIFRSANNSEYYWVMVGASLTEDLLFLSASRIHGTVDYFTSTGTSFLLVSNPKDTPDQWQFTAFDIPETGDAFHLDWTTAVTVKDEWVFIFGRAGEGFNTHSVLSRISISDVKSHNWQQLEYWTYWTSVSPAPSWIKRGESFDRLAPLATLPGNPEGTVQWNEFMNSWFMLNLEFGSFDVKIYRAAELTGPWVGGETVYSIADPWSTAPKEDRIIIYAVKAHAELAAMPNQIMFTYNVNTLGGNFFLLLNKYTDFYVPQCVHVTISRPQ